MTFSCSFSITHRFLWTHTCVTSETHEVRPYEQTPSLRRRLQGRVTNVLLVPWKITDTQPLLLQPELPSGGPAWRDSVPSASEAPRWPRHLRTVLCPERPFAKVAGKEPR